MSYYDPWHHVLKIFITRLLEFIVASVLLGLLAWYALLRWFLHVAFMGVSRLAINGDNIALSAMLGLCLVIGALMTAWVFTWLMMRRPPASDRHHRGARVVYQDEE